MSARAARILDQLAELRVELRDVERARLRLMKRRDALMVRAVAAGATGVAVAAAAGVTPGRVSHVAPRPADEPAAAPRRRARAAAPEASPAAVAVLPADGPAVHPSAASTRQLAHYTPRRTLFARVNAETGTALAFYAGSGERDAFRTTTPAELIEGAMKYGAQRVYVYGGALGARQRGGTAVDHARAFALGELPAGWSTAAAGHYVADADAPVYRWVHENGDGLEVHRFGTWAGGEPDVMPDVVARAWALVDHGLRERFTGGGILSTPATTGRDVWTRTIPRDKSYPVLSDELRELIAVTSGQGRSELLRPGTAAQARQLDGLTGVDGRFMYAALTWGMPVGVPTLHRAPDERAPMARSRWRVRATVPAGWDHVGVLMAPDGGAWRWPSRPGETFTTWADGAEVELARRHGWSVELIEGMSWSEGKPLTTWRDKLVSLWDELRADPSPGAQLGARMVRSIVLHALGAFAARGHKVTRSVPADQAHAIPAGVAPTILDTPAGPLLTWDEAQPLSAWALDLAHPEWSAAVWARARVRLLDAPGGTGALHLPAGTVVAFRTDALYVTGEARELVRAWPDDDKPGRFRVQLDTDTTAPWPATLAELFAIRDDERNTR